MDSNCVNNYLGHVLRAKCWHSLHTQACQKRQAGKTWTSHCAQLIQRLHKDPAPQVSGMKSRFRRVIFGMEMCISCFGNTFRHCSALCWNKSHYRGKKNPTKEGNAKKTYRCGSHYLCCPAGGGWGGEDSTERSHLITVK